MNLSTRRPMHHNYKSRLGKHLGIMLDQQETINTVLSLNLTKMIERGWIDHPEPDIYIVADVQLLVFYKLIDLIAVDTLRSVLQSQLGGRG